MDWYLEVKSAALRVVDAGSCAGGLQVQASEFGTSGIVDRGSRCDGMLFGIVESEAGGMILQFDGGPGGRAAVDRRSEACRRPWPRPTSCRSRGVQARRRAASPSGGSSMTCPR
ncbi:unnamed protein product [Prorocentrum cordatum]|uniref:Uncharacterized protein n=1 Tax=Prorocentrum cordatum TaxID=2364126 RepID=A0ABN9TWC6_9DINO|nr:unnamed protein product [Polarella glacialis]